MTTLTFDGTKKSHIDSVYVVFADGCATSWMPTSASVTSVARHGRHGDGEPDRSPLPPESHHPVAPWRSRHGRRDLAPSWVGQPGVTDPHGGGDLVAVVDVADRGAPASSSRKRTATYGTWRVRRAVRRRMPNGQPGL